MLRESLQSGSQATHPPAVRAAAGLAPAWYTSPPSRKAAGRCFSVLGNQCALWDTWSTYSPEENVIPASCLRPVETGLTLLLKTAIALFFFQTGI